MTGARHAAHVEVPCRDEAVARVLHAAVAVEADEGPAGARVEVRRDGSVLHVSATAPDVSTLRAALNSALRLLDAADRTATGRS